MNVRFQNSNLLVYLFICNLSLSCVAISSPNIILILADDVGWSDFGYNSPESPIPTPFIDSLAKQGTTLSQYYTHSLCTPSRASLLTGLYHVNTGLNFVLVPGTPAGLSSETVTLPEILKEHGNYSTKMVGKWHLGHAQHQMTPVGKGFESFTGIYTWDTDSYTKQTYEEPWKRALMIDWISESDNGTFTHYAEPRHSTTVITEVAQASIRAAGREQENGGRPLFLYVPFTAAHSPLQPLPEHAEKCTHIPHLWRRQFCGMVVGLDEGIRNITETALEVFGNNTIVVVTSDNGGSPWFGGMNAPLRGSKSTPYEGGVRVPALIVDFSTPREVPVGDVLSFDGKMHVSDWLPTLTSMAGIPANKLPATLDGVDLSNYLRNPIRACEESISKLEASCEGPRTEVLLEMWEVGDTAFGEELDAYILGDYKLINGIVRDENYYQESSGYFLKTATPRIASYAMETLIRGLEVLIGEGPFDVVRIILTHKVFQRYLTEGQLRGLEPTLRLYNLKNDPTEAHNLALSLFQPGKFGALKDPADLSAEEKHYVEIIDTIKARLEGIRNRKPPIQKVAMQMHLDRWKETFVPGDCSMNPNIAAKDCRFTHSWVDDSDDPWNETLISADEYTNQKLNTLKINVIMAVITSVLTTLLLWFVLVFKRQ